VAGAELDGLLTGLDGVPDGLEGLPDGVVGLLDGVVGLSDGLEGTLVGLVGLVGLPDGVAGLLDGGELDGLEGVPGDEVAGVAGAAHAGAVGVEPPGGTGAALQVSVYVAGDEAAATGPVTTRTASPVPDAAAGAMVSGATALVPGPAKVTVAGAESVPSDRAQW
jgi:hypothetical protein